jgi:hypothetical protein
MHYHRQVLLQETGHILFVPEDTLANLDYVIGADLLRRGDERLVRGDLEVLGREIL